LFAYDAQNVFNVSHSTDARSRSDNLADAALKQADKKGGETVDSSAISTIATLLVVTGIVVYTIAFFWLIGVGFSLSTGAGIGILFFGWIFYLFILFKNPEASKIPLILAGTAAILCLVGLVLLDYSGIRGW
jgi:hypothetical protein